MRNIAKRSRRSWLAGGLLVVVSAAIAATADDSKKSPEPVSITPGELAKLQAEVPSPCAARIALRALFDRAR